MSPVRRGHVYLNWAQCPKTLLTSIVHKSSTNLCFLATYYVFQLDTTHDKTKRVRFDESIARQRMLFAHRTNNETISTSGQLGWFYGWEANP
jgi:hypothetical protein